jgi:crotonobetainyl-CoA:carnitine CoA-transferase CaiB-like acyl-CoA transferase
VLCAKLGRADLAHDPRFATFRDRRENRAELTRLLDDALRARTTAAWLAQFAGEVPAAPVQDIAQALTSPFVESEDRVWSYPHPERPDFRMVAPAFRLPGSDIPHAAAPALGADTDAVLQDLGYDAARIASLRAQGVV